MKRIQFLRNLKKIPKGIYCYSSIKFIEPDFKIRLKNICPFRSTKQFGNVQVPYCDFLNKGSISFLTDAEYKEFMFNCPSQVNHFSLSEFGDFVKECGIRY